MEKYKVLIICTGNSCRSHMAEGLINHFIGGRVSAASAGTIPSGYVHPLAIEVMAAIGIDISKQQSKSITPFLQSPFDWVITVCDDAAENCPVWPGMGERIHIGFPDPAQAEGSHEEKIAVFEQVRDAIQQKILPFLLEK